VDINFNLLSNNTHSTMDTELLNISVVLKRVSNLSKLFQMKVCRRPSSSRHTW